MKVLLVYPETPNTFWSYSYVLGIVSRKSAYPPLGLLTVAAMLPPHWELRLVDLNVEPLTDAHIRWADYVMLSAMLVHRTSVDAIVDRCATNAKPVIAGGPLFTTCHAAFPRLPHFVLGEAEDVLPQLIDDMQARMVRPSYEAAGRPDITRIPPPRWDLIDLQNYVTMAVQFSRGCPYDCEFCDITIMNGRLPRVKSPEQIIAELEALLRRGWSGMVFVVDDNFIGDRKRAKTLLRTLVGWRERTHPQIGLLAEASLNLADDPELCVLMVRAGFRKVFVGIETPWLESLAECRKTQNERRDLVEAVKTLQRSGLHVMGGFIVGFDSDPHDIFERQFEFIQRSGVATAMVGLLTALPRTRLYERLRQEGRIESESNGNNTDSVLNFTPRLDRKFLITGYRTLMRRLYEPRTYYRRCLTFLANYRPGGPRLPRPPRDLLAVLRSLWLLGVRERGRAAYWLFLWSTLLRRPRQLSHAIELSIFGHHYRRVAARLQ
jgi:radical SAM superfamily enzyme YgiQ (UPF0313 family)